MVELSWNTDWVREASLRLRPVWKVWLRHEEDEGGWHCIAPDLASQVHAEMLINRLHKVFAASLDKELYILPELPKHLSPSCQKVTEVVYGNDTSYIYLDDRFLCSWYHQTKFGDIVIKLGLDHEIVNAKFIHDKTVSVRDTLERMFREGNPLSDVMSFLRSHLIEYYLEKKKEHESRITEINQRLAKL